jgi:hypothetical protein
VLVVILGYQVTQASLEQAATLAAEYQATLVKVVIQELQENLENLGILVPLEYQATLERVGTLEIVVIQVTLEIVVIQGHQVTLAVQDTLERVVIQGHQVSLAIQERADILEAAELVELVATQEKMV